MPSKVDVSLPVAAQPSLDDIVSYARTAESHGYGRAWLPETWGRDGVTTLATIAERTDEIGIGSSILNVYSRSPALLGQTATTLQEASDGRFRLGLGPSGPAVIENWHGIDYDRPLRRTRETVEVVRQLLSGSEVEYDGDFFDLSGFRLRCDAPDPVPGVDVTGMGPKSVELAGRFADGWHGLLLTPDGVRERLNAIERGAEKGGRTPDDVRTMLSITTLAHQDGEHARETVRQHLAFYLGGMGTFYRDSLARQGHEEVAHAIHDAWQAGNREEAKALLSDDLLTALGVAGTPDEAREQLSGFLDIEGLDAVAISFPRGATEDGVQQTLEALAP